MHTYAQNKVELPVKTTLLQNNGYLLNYDWSVELPVKTTLLQNEMAADMEKNVG